jgi:hypothetical protein
MENIRPRKNIEDTYHSWVRDDRLSWKAKGILSFLMDGVNGGINIKEIEEYASDGSHSTKSGINELIKYKYITRKKVRNENGQFESYSYKIHHVPVEYSMIGGL